MCLGMGQCPVTGHLPCSTRNHQFIYDKRTITRTVSPLHLWCTRRPWAPCKCLACTSLKSCVGPFTNIDNNFLVNLHITFFHSCVASCPIVVWSPIFFNDCAWQSSYTWPLSFLPFLSCSKVSLSVRFLIPLRSSCQIRYHISLRGIDRLPFLASHLRPFYDGIDTS